ncbi:MAG TPA: hypothetical protein VFD32_11615 [Dehalococcoidia bacterium]|nr:hypothetical protein [Dehalococcoidia bacterium]
MSKIAASDLLLRRGDEPIIVVEAKSLPVQGDFREPVGIQMRLLAEQTHSPWALLIDPERAQLFRSPDMDHPVAEIPSREIVAAGGFGDAKAVGDSVLTGTAERWLRQLLQAMEFVHRYPALASLADALCPEEEIVSERSYA